MHTAVGATGGRDDNALAEELGERSFEFVSNSTDGRLLLLKATKRGAVILDSSTQCLQCRIKEKAVSAEPAPSLESKTEALQAAASHHR